MHTYIHVHTYIHTYIHVHTCIYTHAYMHTYVTTRTYIHTYIHTYIMHKYMHINTYVHAHTIPYTRARTSIPSFPHKHSDKHTLFFHTLFSSLTPPATFPICTLDVHSHVPSPLIFRPECFHQVLNSQSSPL